MLGRIFGRSTIRYLNTSSTLHEATTIHTDSKAQQGPSSTVDAKEISQFKGLVGIWWDEQGEMKPLHSMNKLRIPFIRDGLKHLGKLNPDCIYSSTPLMNVKILDIGCGGGILSEPLAKLGADVTGVDACQDLLECAKLHSTYSQLKENLNYIYGNIEDLSASHANQFDAVIASEIVEHVSSQELFLKSCVDVLKPGGSLFLTTLNKTNLSWLCGIIGAEYIFNIVPRGTHDWNKFIAPHTIQKMLEINGCSTHLIHGMFYNLISNQWCWIPDTSLNFALHAIKK